MCVRGVQRSEEAIDRLLAPPPFGGTASGVRHDCHLLGRRRHRHRRYRHHRRRTAALLGASCEGIFLALCGGRFVAGIRLFLGSFVIVFGALAAC